MLRVLAVKSDQEYRARRIREVLLVHYEPTHDDPRFCVRRLEVVQHVASALGNQVVNNALFADVAAAGEAVGFQSVKNGNRSLFRFAKRKGQDQRTALALSRSIRLDPRTSGRPSPATQR
jgi:hypothetical protein